MTDVRAFRALRYDPARVDLDRVVVPPYDVIAPDERAVYWDRDPHNAIRLELTRDAADEASTDYREVAQALAAWQQEGALLRDARPAVYALRQRFTAPDGSLHVRDGFFALLHLEDYERRIVRPHERTLSGPKADRLKLFRATGANLSSVFLLYEDPQRTLNELLAARLDAGPAAVARDSAGVEHRLVPVEDADAIDRVVRFLAERPVVIADGHHRYETALQYRDEQRAKPSGSSGGERTGDPDAPYEFTLAYFANAYAPGTLLLPIHRVVREVPAPDDATWTARLPGWSQQRVALPSADAIPALLERHLAPLADRHAFAADDGSGVLRIFSRPRAAGDDLSIRVLHAEVLQGVFGLGDAAVRDGAVAFPKHAPEAAREVRSGRGRVALYLNPLAAEDVFRVTAAGEILPQKSTFFYPKLPSGLVFRLLDGRDFA
jgi:uncharacterized protein (DUF1015 family)